MNFRFALVIALVGTVPLQAKYRPSLIQERTIRNDSVGFHGFTVEFPAGYQHYPIDPAKFSPNVAGAAWSMARDYDRVGHGLTTQEIIVFHQRKQRAIALGVSLGAADLVELNKSERELRVDQEAQQLQFPPADPVVRSTLRIGDRLVAQAVREFVTPEKQKFVNVVCVVFGDLKERFTFNGIALLEGQDLLIAEMHAMIGTLDLSKPKKPRQK